MTIVNPEGRLHGANSRPDSRQPQQPFTWSRVLGQAVVNPKAIYIWLSLGFNSWAHMTKFRMDSVLIPAAGCMGLSSWHDSGATPVAIVWGQVWVG